MCVDFTDLNKACPKDSFSLPRIDLIVDSTTGHTLLNFMDAYSGYNQIRMSLDDEEKTAFITDRGLYCYIAMSFGLKNVGATYQRLVNRMFKDQIGRNIEVYVDDLLVKSKKAEQHFNDLREAFTVLRKYNMKLNPEKCIFKAESGKFLGFMVLERAIEANPEKFKAIIEMQPPRTINEVQKIVGKIAALSRFIVKSTDRSHPFFKVLRKAQEWNEECSKAFSELKEYLSHPPLLSQTMPGEDLTVYLAVSQHAVSAALTCEENEVQHLIYYISRAFRGAEAKYPRIEMLAFALVIAARRLRLYFQSHPMKVQTDVLLRKVLQKPDVTGRMTKWAIE